jgi:hypothetical protein
MIDELSRFTSEVWASGVSNVKHKKPPGGILSKGRGGLKSYDVMTIDVS